MTDQKPASPHEINETVHSEHPKIVSRAPAVAKGLKMLIAFKCTERKETVTHLSFILTPLWPNDNRHHPNYKYGKLFQHGEFLFAVEKGNWDGVLPEVDKIYQVVITDGGDIADIYQREG